MITNRVVQKLILVVVTVFTVFVYPTSIFASTGVERDTIEPEIFGPATNTNLGERGVLQTVFYIGGYFILVIFFLVLIFIVFNGIKMIVSRDDSAKLEEGSKAIQNFSIGIVVALFFLILYGIISLMLGGVNMFTWTSKLAQCHDGEFLFKAEYSAAVVNPDIFNTEALIYCCENLTITAPSSNRNGEKSWDIERHINIPGAAVGTKEDGGWMFIADPDGDRTTVIPDGIEEAQGCKPFTI